MKNDPHPMLENICKIALPHIITVFVSYIYYDVSNPADEFVNKDACYTMEKAILSKDITTNETLINIMLVVGVMNNLTVHYFSAPLMFILLWCGEISYSVGKMWKAYSTLFIVILGVVVGLSQEFGSPIYNGSVWFNVGMSIAINFVFHCILFGANYRCNDLRNKIEGGSMDGEAEAEVGEETCVPSDKAAEIEMNGCDGDEV